MKRILSIMRRFFASAAFRARMSIYFSLLFNLLYAAFKIAIGVLYRSAWQASEAAYYLLLILVRLLLARKERCRKENADRASEWKTYRLCGVLIFFFDLLIACAIAGTVRLNLRRSYSGILLYIFGGYTLYRTALTVRQTLRFHQAGDPIFAAAKALNLSATALSLYAFLLTFGAVFLPDDALRYRLSSYFGAAFCLLLLLLPSVMIRRSSRILAEWENIK